MSKIPHVSIIMSVYNGEDYVKDAIESILNQTYSNFEFIIIDDGSTDETPSIIDGYDDNRIKVIHQENKGLTKSLNLGLKQANGDYIARIDSDDISLPKRLEKQVDLLRNNSEVGMVGTFYCVLDMKNNEIRYLTPPTESRLLKDRLVKSGTPFRHSTVMIRKKAIEKVGFYNERYKQGQDYELWIRIAKYYKLANIPEFLGITRVNWEDSIVARRSNLENLKLHLHLQLKALNKLSYSHYYYYYIIRSALWSLIPKHKIKKILPVSIVNKIRNKLHSRNSDILTESQVIKNNEEFNKIITKILDDVKAKQKTT